MNFSRNTLELPGFLRKSEDDLSNYNSPRSIAHKLKGAYAAVLSVTFMSIYYCTIKYLTMTSHISNFDLMYHRSIWGLIFLGAYNAFFRRSKNEKRSSFFQGVSRQQSPLILIRVMSETISHLLLFSAMKIMAASKVILILENPFLMSMIAFFTIGESITKHEVFVFILATIGIALISQDEVTPQKSSKIPKQTPHHPNEYDWERDIYGVGFAVTGAVIANIGMISVR